MSEMEDTIVNAKGSGLTKCPWCHNYSVDETGWCYNGCNRK